MSVLDTIVGDLADLVGLSPGTPVDRWEVDELAAEGGFAEVYRGFDGNGVAVALKVLRRSLDGSVVRRFRREAAFLRAVRHPNLVRLVGHGALEDGRPYLALEWLEGNDLAAELRMRGPLGVHAVADIIGQIAGALDALHAAGVVHRDVKAPNVILGRDGRATLVDLGVADTERRLAGVRAADEPFCVGTPHSMSPEQVRGCGVDRRTDVYGLGVLAYQLLTGKPPFLAPGVFELQDLHLHMRPPRVPAVPPAVADVIDRCLAKDKENRFASAGEAACALRESISARALACA